MNALLCEKYDDVLAEYLLIKRMKSKTVYPQLRPYFQINSCRVIFSYGVQLFR